MGFSLKGYVLEKPRVGSANSAFTTSPDNFVSDSGAFSAAYTTNESSPGRTEYLAVVLVDGDLPDVEIGWTKNEGLLRIDYDGSEGKFRTLPGGRRQEVGTLDPNSNTERFTVQKPFLPSGTFPFRLAVGATGSGTTFSVTLCSTDAEFSTPSSGTVELSLETGNLNWNPTDITLTFVGQKVFFQQQRFFPLKESKGFLGTAGVDTIILNPIPGPANGGAFQKPLLRFGYGLYLSARDVANEASFSSDPVQGSFEWARDTGRVKFNSADLAANTQEAVYYDGVLFETGKTFPRQTLGTVSSPGAIAGGLPPEGGDVFFRARDLSTFASGSATFPNQTTLQDGAANFTAGINPGDIVVLTSGPNAGARRAVRTVTVTQVTVSPAFPSTDNANYIIERKRSIQQFAQTYRVEEFTNPGQTGAVEINKTTSAVQFSFFDKLLFGSREAEVIFGDLPIERGISLRFFRSPVNLQGTSAAKDMSAFFGAPEARLADPIIGSPVVFLPVLPVDDPAFPMVFEVQQGTGLFTGFLTRLDVPSPPSGIGYTINFEEKQFNFAVRRNNLVLPVQTKVGAVQLPNALVDLSNNSFELDHGMGYTPLVLGVDALLDGQAGVLSFVEQRGGLVYEGAGGLVDAGTLDTFEDADVDFIAVGAQAGDLLVVTGGDLKGVYDITSVAPSGLGILPNAALPTIGIPYEIRRGKEVMADRYFQELLLPDPNTKVERIRSLGAISNAPRLSLPRDRAASSRFRFASGTFSTSVTVVSQDADFSAPASLMQGVVEVSSATGNVNFSQDDVSAGGNVFWVVRLIQGKDYRIGPELGTIQPIERLLSFDEMLITYSNAQDPETIIEERATFLVRKELATHPTPTSSVSFNPTGRSIALDPAPTVFRGGRPQDTTQISVDPVASKITFLPDKLPTPAGFTKITDALPHGEIVHPVERIFVDYFVYEAIGGENTTTVLKPPMNLARILITEGQTSFKVKGDRTLDFPPNRVLRIENEQLYFLSGSTYDPATNDTTVNLLAPQAFRDTFQDPKLYITSGPVRSTPAPFQAPYFTLEMASFDQVPRGMNSFRIQGDLTGAYFSGTIVYFSQGSSANEFYFVSGVTYDQASDRTVLTITQTTLRQYNPGVHVLRRSVRPIFESNAKKVRTSASPALPPGFTALVDSVLVFRKFEDQPGQILGSPVDFSLDESGVVEFTEALRPNEEFSILYTRYRSVAPGQLRASYTASIAPSEDNGLLNQILIGSLTTFIPDSFYFRVETMTNFRGEVAQQYKDAAQAASPSSGPRVDNASQPKLYEQGQESIFFDEGRYANEDIIARAVLKFYNDAINYLEDVLQNMDGRIVGDRDGRFKFDGTTGSPVLDFDLAENQIDDFYKISDFPIDFTPPLLPFKFLGTYQKAYQPSGKSRFFPTFRIKAGYCVVGGDTGAETGDQMVDFETKPLLGPLFFPVVTRKFPRARITADVTAGSVEIPVDTTAAVEEPPFRPAFQNGMKVVIEDASTVYIDQSASVEISSMTGTSITLASPVLTNIPVGATIFLANDDEVYQKNYRIGFDVMLDLEKGFLTYVKPFPPFDGTVAGLPPELEVQDPDSGEMLQALLLVSNNQTDPQRIPALFGKPFDDDGDQRYPLLGPIFEREYGLDGPNYLDSELAFVQGGGTLTTDTVVPYVGTGSLNPGGTVITNSVAFPAPVPQPGDLVRILNGANGITDFRRVIAVSANTVTVDVAFSVAPDAGFSFLVTAANNLTTGNFTTIVGPVVTDLFANFTAAGVLPGHTVVVDSGHPAQFERRQIVSVDSPTQVTLSAPFSNVTTPVPYRIHNPLNTFSDITDLQSTSSGLLGLLSTNANSEIASIDAFYERVFTDKLTPQSAVGNVAGNSLTGVGVDFAASGVTAGDFVYVTPTQAAEGIFLIAEVIDATTLTIADPSFPSSGAVSFRIVKAFGVGEKTLKDTFSIRQQTSQFVFETANWNTLVTTAIPVVVPPGVQDATYFARGFGPTSVTDRLNSITNRKTNVPLLIEMLEAVMASNDLLYEKRFTWVDARVNLEKGILPGQERALTRRQKAQREAFNQLIKLLAVED